MISIEEEEEVEVDVSMTMSKRCLPPTYSPSLVLSHGKGYKYNEQTFYTLSDGSYHVRSVPQLRRMYVFTSAYGWLMLRSYQTLDCCLFNPVSLKTINLPCLIDNSYNECVLTTSPTDPNCVVMCISNVKRSYIYCRIGDNKWYEQQLRSKNNDDILMEGRISFITCEGKAYLFFEQAIGVVSFHDTFSSVELQRMSLPEPALPWATHEETYFVESCGEIFRISEIRFGLSNKLVFNFDVFKLDLSTLDWKKVDNLGDRIFLLGHSSMSVSATELGMKGNCIYFCIHQSTTFNKFDMDDGTLTVSLPCPKKFSHWEHPFWVVPNCKLQVKKDLAKVDKPQGEGNQKQSCEASLPVELLELVSSYLTLGDCIRFRLTSKSQISIPPVLQSNCLPITFESGSQELPWLMSFPRNKGACKLYHPIYSDAYTMNIPELAGATIRSAKYGWLLMSRGKLSFFFLNPFTMETIKLPDMKSSYEFTGMSFSSPPTTTDFVVIGYVGGCFYVYRKGEEIWCEYLLDGKLEFIVSPCNPVFCDGVFYCLSNNGKLGVFDPMEITEESQWKIIPKSQLLPYSDASNYTKCIKNFILDYDGDILSAFVGYLGKSVLIYKLNRSEMRWERLESLGDKVLFLSHTASMLLPAGLKGIENRIYFPTFHDRDNLFYSLSTGKYHSFGSKHSAEDWINACEHLHCTWIQFTK